MEPTESSGLGSSTDRPGEVHRLAESGDAAYLQFYDLLEPPVVAQQSGTGYAPENLPHRMDANIGCMKKTTFLDLCFGLCVDPSMTSANIGFQKESSSA